MGRWIKRILGTIVLLALVFIVSISIVYFTVEPDGAVQPTVTTDPTIPHVELDGVVFHAEAFGPETGPPIVVIHGGPGGDFRSLLNLRALAEDGYRVTFYDQRGSGLSPRVPASELSLQSSIEDLHRIVLWAGGGEKVALIGHSWGGILAAYYLGAHPEFVARAVLAEPGVLTSEEMTEFAALIQPTMSFGTIWYAINQALASTKLDGPDDAAATDYLVGKMMMAPGDNPLNGYWCGGRPTKGALDYWRVGSTAMTAILEGARQSDDRFVMPPLNAERYTDEVLLLATSCNTLIGETRQRAHLKLLPTARLHVIMDSGHSMFIDQPERSLSVVRAYLKGATWAKGTK